MLHYSSFLIPTLPRLVIIKGKPCYKMLKNKIEKFFWCYQNHSTLETFVFCDSECVYIKQNPNDKYKFRAQERLNRFD